MIKRLSTNTFPLPRGGLLQIYREGLPEQQAPRQFSVRHMPTIHSPENEISTFYSKSTLPQIGIEYLALCAKLIRPQKIILLEELHELWQRRIASDVSCPQLSRIEIQFAYEVAERA